MPGEATCDTHTQHECVHVSTCMIQYMQHMYYIYIYVARAHAVLPGTCNRLVGSRTVALLKVNHSDQHFSTSLATGNTNHLNSTSYTSVA